MLIGKVICTCIYVVLISIQLDKVMQNLLVRQVDGWSHLHFYICCVCLYANVYSHLHLYMCCLKLFIFCLCIYFVCHLHIYCVIYAEGLTCILVELIIYPDNKIICKTYWLVYTDWWNHLHLYICSVNLCADGWSHLHNSLLRLFRLMNSSALVHIYYVCLYANGYALVHVHLHRDKQS